MRLVPDNFIVCDPKNPIMLVGEADRMCGTVCVRNRSDKRVAIHRNVVLRLSPSGVSGKGQADEIECDVSMLAMVGPGERIDVPIVVSLPSFIPPGEHQAVLALGPATYPVKMLVAESIDIGIAPAQIFVSAKAGRVCKSAVFSNYGNVPVTVGCFGAVPLDDDRAGCRILRATLKDAPADTETISQWTSRYFHKAGEHLERLGMLWVETEGGPVTVGPGESALVNLKVRVPNLASGSRYIGIVPFYNANIEIVVVPETSHGQKDPGDLATDSVVVPKGAEKARRSK